MKTFLDLKVIDDFTICMLREVEVPFPVHVCYFISRRFPVEDAYYIRKKIQVKVLKQCADWW